MSKFMCNNLRNSMTKNRFLEHVHKTECIKTKQDLELLMLLKGNSFQNVTFFASIHKKVEKNDIFVPKSQIFAFSMPFNLTEMV